MKRSLDTLLKHLGNHIFCIWAVAWAVATQGQEIGNIVTLGSVQVDARTGTMMISGWVNQVSGAIELLACGPGGKTHESVFVLNCNPVDMQAGLLLLGLKPGTPPTGLGQGQPKGTALDIWVDWLEDSEPRSLRAENFVANVENKRKPLSKTPWIFTGSVIENGEFKALAEQSLIVTYWDPWAIVNLPLLCGSNDEILIVNSNCVPTLKTPVTFRFRAR
jgi:hypothetical protein